jgi:hypothetical protein
MGAGHTSSTDRFSDDMRCAAIHISSGGYGRLGWTLGSGGMPPLAGT